MFITILEGVVGICAVIAGLMFVVGQITEVVRQFRERKRY